MPALPREFVFSLLKDTVDDKKKLYITSRNAGSVTWKALLVHTPEDIFQLKNDGTTGSIRSIQCNDAGNKARKFIVAQAVYTKTDVCINSHVILENQSLGGIASFSVRHTLPELKIVGPTGPGGITLALSSSNKIFMLYHQAGVNHLYFLPDNTEKSERWLPVMLPTAFTVGATLQANAVLISATVHQCHGAPTCLEIIDLNLCTARDQEHYGPYTIEHVEPADAVRTRTLQLMAPPPTMPVQTDVVPAVNITSSNGRFNYTWTENNALHTDGALLDGYAYNFVYPQGVALFGCDATGEKVRVNGKKAKHENNTQYSEILLCDESRRLLLPTPVSVLNPFGVVPHVGIIATLVSRRYALIQKDATSAKICTLLESGKNLGSFKHVQMNEFGLSGQIVATHVQDAKVFIHTSLQNHDNNAAKHQIWCYDYSEKTLTHICKLAVDKKCDAVFMEKHEENLFNADKSPAVCLSAFCEDYSYFTCTCAGNNVGTNRFADVFASEKAYFQAQWDDYYDRPSHTKFGTANANPNPHLLTSTSLSNK